MTDHLQVGALRLEVIAVPGHTADHIALYDPEKAVLLIGDAFIGQYFSSPNPDVDSLAWIETLERLLALDIDIMVGGHGHVHSVSAQVPPIPGVVIREYPRDVLNRKLDVLQWVRDQVNAGNQEGLTVRAIEATCFPWGRRWSWERKVGDELARLFSRGEFSRTQLVRSFARTNNDPLPDVLQVKLWVDDRPTNTPTTRLDGPLAQKTQ